VIVDVNEAGSENQAVGVEDTFAGSSREFADRDDAVATDAESAFAEWSAGAVGELGVEYEDRIGRLRIRLRGSAKSQVGGKGEERD